MANRPRSVAGLVSQDNNYLNDADINQIFAGFDQNEFNPNQTDNYDPTDIYIDSLSDGIPDDVLQEMVNDIQVIEAQFGSGAPLVEPQTNAPLVEPQTNFTAQLNAIYYEGSEYYEPPVQDFEGERSEGERSEGEQSEGERSEVEESDLGGEYEEDSLFEYSEEEDSEWSLFEYS